MWQSMKKKVSFVRHASLGGLLTLNVLCFFFLVPGVLDPRELGMDVGFLFLHFNGK